MLSCFSDLVNKLVKERDADAPTKIVKDDNQEQAMTIDFKMSKYNQDLHILVNPFNLFSLKGTLIGCLCERQC